MITRSFRDSIWSRVSLRHVVHEDSRTFSNAKKNLIMFGVCWGVSLPGISSTVYFPGIPSITNDLHASDIAITLTTALFILATGIAPVFWASISDRYQVRRILFFISLFIFATASLVSALVNNIWVLVVFRMIQAFGSSCCFCNGSEPGIISDIYPVEQRGSAFSKFYFAFFFGPLIGPIKYLV
ncbi:MFS general substrate transporter [Backusella circina FSU 941]|nr:MFS general substrate transporter [Backusella circina FSU 941]